ncbi:mycosubtilin synthase subunit C-like, partial [Homalodisca vitripennis]|uniref:mycosubtilin synthase subunit C-like n=1 Tax=Homalodisca vitripennis TaxID=197043 RepID=UPI001EEB7A54
MSTPGVDMSDYEQLGCLHDLFIRQAQKTPGKVAVVDCDGSQITFEELDRMSDLLANKLHRLGLGKNKVGGILMERSLEYTVAYLGILKAGGAYLPIEVSWPKTLLDSVLDDVNPSVICTKEALSARITHSGIPFFLLEGDWLQQLRHEQKDLPMKSPVKCSLDDIAYVVYSSGTTGKPKGIQCPHRGAVFSFTWRHRAYPYNEHDREACNVFFVWEMLRPLAQGIPMYIIPDDTIYDPPKLAQFILRNKITRMLFTPSLLQALLEYKGVDLQRSLKSLRQIVYCGEVLTTVLRNKVAGFLPWIQQLNLYSISECHDVSNADLSDPQLDLSSRQFCPVGRLLTGVQVVVLDQDLNIKSVGEPGEIYVGGPGLAIGYLNRPDLNKAKFIARPAHVPPSVGDRLYRTGDWGYLLSDGSLEVCGRCDTMVKIRGYTVELEAVKTNLMDLPGILSACIQAFGPEGEDKTLVAFVTPQENVTLSNRELRLQLKKRLPFYMIPSR